MNEATGGADKAAAKSAAKTAGKAAEKAAKAETRATGPSEDVKAKFKAALDAKNPADNHGTAGGGGAPSVRGSEVHGPRKTFRRKSG